MLRRLLSIAAGILTAVLTVAIVESIGHSIYPPPPGIDVSDPEALKLLMPSIPTGAKAFVILAWALGSFFGGWVAARLAGDPRTGAALAVGFVMLAAGGYSIYAIPHPAWMAVLGLLLPLPIAVLGGKLAYQSSTAGKNSATRSS